MENVLERIYKGNIENGKEFKNVEVYLNNMKEIATLLQHLLATLYTFIVKCKKSKR